MNMAELNNLDFNNAGAWPLPAKLIASLIVMVAVAAFGYWYDTQNLLVELEGARQTEIRLKEEFKSKQETMANIDDYRKQLEELQGMLAAMLMQLPTRTEMPDLLEDVSNTGKSNGLVFELFKPEDEQPRDFYAAKPITIRARGTYHQFSEFVSSVAALPRIVTLQKAELAKANVNPNADKQSAGNDDELTINAILQTYRYMDANEGGS